MTQPGLQLDEEKLCCSICLDVLKVPVTIPCGHSYCMNCIRNHWDGEDPRKIYSCPQCRVTFVPRPVLGKNTMLSDLVEEMQKIGLQVAPQCYAQPAEVACDFCTGRKLKAVKSCLQCLASYCELHLQPHYDSPTFQKHKLVGASANIQENICSHHNKVKEIFCRSDQQSICYLCSVEDHKGHDTVSTAAERTERQKEIGPSRQNILQRIKGLEKDEKLLQKEMDNINTTADQAAKDSQAMFIQLLQFMEKLSSEVQQQIKSQQETEVTRAKVLREKLQQEITELRRNDVELEQLSLIEDHNQFLLKFASLASLTQYPDQVHVNVRPAGYFKKLTAAVSEVTQHLQDNLRQEWSKVTLTKADVLLAPAETEILSPLKAVQPQVEYDNLPSSAPSAQKQFKTSPTSQTPPECEISPSPAKESETSLSRDVYETPNELDISPSPAVYPMLPLTPGSTQRRADFLVYSCHITLDPNTVNKQLILSEANRKVMSRESLTGRCYWEVECNGIVSVAVTYKNIRRSGNISGFGNNDMSWALYCHNNKFIHRCMSTNLYGPPSSRVGVYLDHRAGILSFYSVSEPMTLLHRVQTTFTQPLHFGLCVASGSAELIQLL